MKKIVLKYSAHLCSCIFLFATPLFAQKEVKFGKVDQSDLDMKYYEKDSGAEAIVLYDFGDVSYIYETLADKIKIIMKYHRRIKVFKTSGKDYANITLPYFRDNNGNREVISNIDGFTYNNENGKIIKTKLTNESIFDEHIADKKYEVKITMPNVKEGSVFEYSYMIETPFYISTKPKTWFFQERIPVEWSELSMVIPDYFHYKIILGGYYPLFINKNEPTQVNLTGQTVTGTDYRFVMKDVPAFHTEPFITAEKNYVSKVDFELSATETPNADVKNYTETWEDITKTLLASEYFGDRLKQTNYLKDIVNVLSVISDSTAKMKAAFGYVATNIKWDETSSVFAKNSLKSVFDNKKGSVAEVNLLLVSLLRELGFESNPVILSTRSNGKIKEEFPMLADFNYVIAQVQVGGKDILMDATNPLTVPGMLPERCLNGNGRLIKKEATRFISLEPTEKYAGFEMITAAIDASGEIKGNYSLSGAGYLSLYLKTIIWNDGEKKAAEIFIKNKPDWEISNFKIEKADSTQPGFKMSCDFTSSSNASAGIIYLNPMLTGRINKNPYSALKRIYPVDLARASDETFVASIKIPEGYTAEDLPESVIIKIPDNGGKFIYSVDVADNAIRVSSRLSIYKTHFSADEYAYLRELYNKIIQKQSEQIVLKRK